MSKLKTSYKRGFSLVELVIAMALGIFILTSAFVVLSNLFHSSTSFSQRQKVNAKLDAIVEQIKIQAIGSFPSMTEVNQVRYSTVYPEISVFSTISDVDPASKTRRATLRAEYWVGRGSNRVIQTSTKTFNFGNLYASGSGAAIDIRVVDQNSPTTGVGGIRIQTEGQGTPIVVGTTGPDGRVTIFGVKESSVNIRADLNTYNTKAYFEGPPPSFNKSVYPANPLAMTQAGQPPVHFDDVEVILPGSMRGTVRDAGVTVNPPGIPDITVQIYPARVPNNNTGDPLEPNPVETVTDTNGNFNFYSIVPGAYYLLIAGRHSGSGDLWCGVDVPGSSDTARLRSSNAWGAGNNFPNVFIVNPGPPTTVPDQWTVHRGELTGGIRVLNSRPGTPERTFGTAPYLYETAGDTPVTFFTEKDKTITADSISAPAPNNYLPGGNVFRWRTYNTSAQNHNYSILGKEFFFASNTQYGYQTVTSDSIGDYVFSNTWPVIVFPQNLSTMLPADHLMKDQSYVMLPYRTVMPAASNAAPVTVAEKPGTNELTFYIRSASWDTIVLPRSNGGSTIDDTTDFEFPLFANGNMPGNQNRTITFLKRSNEVFARARGTIRTTGLGAVPSQPDSHWVDKYIQSQFATQSGVPTTLLGCGLLAYDTSFNGWILQSQRIIPLVDTNGGAAPATYPFDLIESGQNLIVPTLGADKQSFIARFQSIPISISSVFQSNVFGFTKRLSSLTPGNTVYLQLQPSDVDITNVYFSASAEGNPPHLITGTLNVNNGQFSHSTTAQKVEARELLLGPTDYAPGQNRNFGTMDLDVSTNIARPYRVTLATSASSTDGWAYVGSTWDTWRRFLGQMNPSGTSILYQPDHPTSTQSHYIPSFVRRPKFVVTGRVRRTSDSSAVVGAQVRISGLFFSQQFLTTNGAGQFDSTSIAPYFRVTPVTDQDDITVQVTPTPPLQQRYVSFEVTEEVIDAILYIHLEFLMSETSGGYGTGGSG